MQPLRKTPDGSLVLSLHVQPGAKRTEIVGIHGEAIKLRLAAPPVDGKANACLLAFLAEFMRVPKRAITLLSGEASRSKLVRIDGAPLVAIQQLLSKIELKLD